MLNGLRSGRIGQRFRAATGTGSLEQARGEDHLSADGVTLTGEQDIFGHPVDTAALAAAEAAPAPGRAASGTATPGPGRPGREARGRAALW